MEMFRKKTSSTLPWNWQIFCFSFYRLFPNDLVFQWLHFESFAGHSPFLYCSRPPHHPHCCVDLTWLFCSILLTLMAEGFIPWDNAFSGSGCVAITDESSAIRLCASMFAAISISLLLVRSLTFTFKHSVKISRPAKPLRSTFLEYACIWQIMQYMRMADKTPLDKTPPDKTPPFFKGHDHRWQNCTRELTGADKTQPLLCYILIAFGGLFCWANLHELKRNKWSKYQRSKYVHVHGWPKFWP